MTVGLYFGSFNPIHIGHLIIANHILNESQLKQIWFIVSPLNPFKDSTNLMNEYDRLHLIQKATENDPRLEASNIEFSLSRPSYTIHTLAYLKERYPSYSFSIIMGSDGFQNLDKWKNSEIIIRDYSLIIYKRPGFEINNTAKANIAVMDAPLLQISSTHIRELIRAGKSIKYLVPANIEEEILASGFFKTLHKK
jgi:nicotinate-nucleotide adenylyltransferase